MAKAPTAIQQGFDYQDRYFWKRVCDLFDRSTHVERVSYETDEPRGFDDVVVTFDAPVHDGTDSPARDEYTQVKFHVTAASEITWQSLMDPEAIGGTTRSLLMALHEAQRSVADPSSARFVLVSLATVDASDPLAALIRSEAGELDLDLLRTGKTRKSKMGAVRLGWRDHLKFENDEQLISLLKPLRIRRGPGTLYDASRQLSERLAAVGLEPIDAAKRVDPYADLLRRLQRARLTSFKRTDIERHLRGEGLLARGGVMPAEVEVVPPVTLERRTADRQDERITATIPQPLAGIGDAPTPGPPVDEFDASLNAQLDAAKALLDAVNPSAARPVLEFVALSADGKAVQERTRFRLAMNLGACSLLEGDSTTARTHFARALELDPKSPKALVASAQTALILGDPERALAEAVEARQVEPRNATAFAISLHALDALGRRGEIASLLDKESWSATEADVVIALGLIAYRHDEYDAADVSFRNILSKDPRNDGAQELLAATLLERTETKIKAGAGGGAGLPTDAAQAIQEAEQLFSDALESRRVTANPQRRGSVLLARARTRGLLGKHAEALGDVDAALALPGVDTRALVVRGLELLALGRNQEAVDQLRVLEGAEARASSSLLAAALLNLDRAREAEVLLRPLWPYAMGTPDGDAILESLLDAHRRLGQFDMADRILQDALDARPTDAALRVLAARHVVRRGDRARGEVFLSEAERLLESDPRSNLAGSLSAAWSSVEKFDRAVAALGHLQPEQFTPELRRQQLVALFNAGEYRSALALAVELLGDGPVQLTLSEIEAMIREFCGDTTRAATIWKALATANPKRLDFQLHSAWLAVRRGLPEDAKSIAATLHPEDFYDSAQRLLQLAQLSFVLGLSDPLRAAYEAARRHPDDPDAQMGFFFLFLTSDQKAPYVAPDVAGPGAGVVLRVGTEERTYVILREGEVPVLDRELTPSDPLAMQLSGRRAGETVTLQVNPYQANTTGEIQVVAHPYAVTFRHIGATYTTRFPGQQNMVSVQVQEGDVTPILTAVEEREQRVLKCLTAYRAGQMSLEGLGRLLGRSATETWAFLTSSKERGIVMSLGDKVEGVHEAAALTSAATICLDVTALLTLRAAGLFDTVARSGLRSVVTQATVDILQEEILQLRTGPTPSATMGKDGERFVWAEVGAADVASAATYVEGLLAFCRDTSEVVPTYRALDRPRDLVRSYSDSLGSSAYSSLLASHEQGAVLVSDDACVRALAQGEEGVQATSSLGLVADLTRRKVVSRDQYIATVIALARMHYQFLRLSTDDVVHLLRRDDFVPTKDVFTMLELLDGPACSQETALPILCQLLVETYRSVHLPERRVPLLDALIKTTVAGRSATIVLGALQRVFEKHPYFQLNPIQLADLEAHLANWKKATSL